MLTYIHQIIGSLVVITNLIAAFWLWLLDRWEQPLVGGARWALWTARATLLLQVLLGLSLIGSGAVGRSGHYLFAMAALTVSWFTFTASRRAAAGQVRMLAFGCAAVGLCALGAYLLGR